MTTVVADRPWETRAQVRTSGARAPRERWPWLLALGALAVYIAVGHWMLYTRGFEIGDALTKTSAAQHVIASRDPHLAAMGFYWMPLPQLSQVPFVWMLQPFGYARFAGPLMSACWGAAVIPVVAAIGRSVGAAPRVRVALTVAYAISPVAIWSSADGMSEASSFFFMAVTLLGYSRWVRTRTPNSLASVALGLAGLMLCRYEALAVMVVVAACCALQTPRERWVRTATIVCLPTLYVFGLWLFASRLIVNDAFFWLKTLIRIGKASGTGARIYASDPTIVDMVRFGLIMTIVISLLLLVTLPTVLHRDRTTLLRNLGFALPGLVFPGIVFLQQLRGTAPGQTRYYYPAWLVGTVVALDFSGRLRGDRSASVRRRRRVGAIQAALGVVAVVSVAAQLVGLSEPRISTVESEHLLFAPLIGRTSPAANATELRLKSEGWKQMFARLDSDLGRGAHLMLDTDSSPDGPLFTRHADQLVIPEDRDFEQILAAPKTRVDYIAYLAGAGSSSRYLPGMIAIVNSTVQGTWEKVGEFGTDPRFAVIVYRAVPA